MRVLIPASSLLVTPRTGCPRGFAVPRTLPYPSLALSIERRPSFGGPLNPDHSRRIHAGRVSYYALFKGMAASKPTSSLSRHGHILRYTQRPLRDLSCGSGFFPSRRWTLSLSDCLPGSIRQVFGVWLGLVGASPPRAHPVALPPADSGIRQVAYAVPRLYLNRFRGEPQTSVPQTDTGGRGEQPQVNE